MQDVKKGTSYETILFISGMCNPAWVQSMSWEISWRVRSFCTSNLSRSSSIRMVSSRCWINICKIHVYALRVAVIVITFHCFCYTSLVASDSDCKSCSGSEINELIGLGSSFISVWVLWKCGFYGTPNDYKFYFLCRHNSNCFTGYRCCWNWPLNSSI